jgi:hypothetical protein
MSSCLRALEFVRVQWVRLVTLSNEFTNNHTHSSCMFGWCENVFYIVRKWERVYMCTENPGISVESLSPCHFLSSLRNQQWHIVPVSVSSMIICEDNISNLVRSSLFGLSVTDRFDTMMPGVPGYTQTLLPRSLPPTHTTYTHRERERRNTPPPSITHTYKRETDITWERVCVCVCEMYRLGCINTHV